MQLVSWTDINRAPEAGEFSFGDGTLTVSFAELAIWKRNPSALFRLMRKHPIRSRPQYVLGEQIDQGQSFYESSNGDVWYLTLDAASGRRVVVHRPNAQSGGRVSLHSRGNFPAGTPGGPAAPGAEATDQPSLRGTISTELGFSTCALRTVCILARGDRRSFGADAARRQGRSSGTSPSRMRTTASG